MSKKKYDTIYHFLEDPSFKNWVKQKNATDINFWEFWIDDNSEKKELVYKARDIVLGISFQKKRISSEKVASEWEKLERKINIKKRQEKRRINFLKKSFSIAASIVLLVSLGAYIINKNTKITHKTDYGEILKLTLKDGSNVTLNSNSSLSYYKKNSRKVWLSGEAFFKVDKKKDYKCKISSFNKRFVNRSLWNIF